MPRDQWLLYTPQNVFNGHFPTATIHSILDIGCGLSIKSQFVSADVRVALDIHRPYLERGREQAQTPNIIYLNANAQDIDKLFLPRSFDCVMAMDFIEHLPKAQGFDFLEKCEQIARRAVIIETPLGHVYQNMDILGMGGDEYQTHRSAWYEHDFTERGYYVEKRPYTMTDIQRHTTKYQPPNITMLFCIKQLDTDT